MIDMQSFRCCVLPRLSLYQHIPHLAWCLINKLVKYMKLFDARSNITQTFGLVIKQFLTDSNLEFSDILKTPSYFVLPPMVCQTTEDCAGSNAHEERLHRFICLSIDTGTMSTFLFTQMIHRMGILWLVLQYFHQTQEFP